MGSPRTEARPSANPQLPNPRERNAQLFAHYPLHTAHAMCIYLRMERNSRQIVKRLVDEGFELVKVAGSHHKFRKADRVVIVPHPKKDLPLGTARNIAKMAGWL